MITSIITNVFIALNLIVLAYFLVLNTLYLVSSLSAYFILRQHRRRWTSRELDGLVRSPATPAVSLIVPGYNEEAGIVDSTLSTLLLNYPRFEVVVINDGSKDRTLERLVEAFNLVRAPVTYPEPVPTKLVRAVYRSITNQDIVVIDKENGGKADAMNAGINAARHPLVCVMDADSLLEERALTRAVIPFIEDPRTVASGGIIRVLNGCTVEAGRVTSVHAPRNLLAQFQVVEYLRAFLAGRVSHSALNALLIISGAFGLFRRDIVVAAGGFRHDTIGEDMELVTRLHRVCLERGEPYRIVFQPDPVCWTEAPESAKVLGGQRNRWQRGTLQVLSYHRDMIFNRRYGVIGMLAMPYYALFEALGPLLELIGYVATFAAIALGFLDWRFAQLLFLAAILYGTLISMAAVLLEEASFRRYERVTDLLRLMFAAVIENLGYRQLTTWWRVKGTIDFLRGKNAWGAMPRKGLARPN